jgi:hypothetical protein
MMAVTVIPYVHPSIRAWQRAYEAYFKTAAPRVSRRTSKGFVIHGGTGDSQADHRDKPSAPRQGHADLGRREKADGHMTDSTREPSATNGSKTSADCLPRNSQSPTATRSAPSRAGLNMKEHHPNGRGGSNNDQVDRGHASEPNRDLVVIALVLGQRAILARVDAKNKEWLK